jgi:DNA-binding response OmpR family regulator
VILVSGHTPPSQVFKARDAGANFTIAKPITPKIVLERILWAAKEERQFIECDSYLGPTGGSRTTVRRPAARAPPRGSSRKRSARRAPNMSRSRPMLRER